MLSQTSLTHQRQKTPSRATISNREEHLRREATSPNFRKISTPSVVQKSLSPMKSISRTGLLQNAERNDQTDNKEEKSLQQKIKMAQQEQESLLKMLVKAEADFTLKKNKCDEDRRDIINVFTEFVINKNVAFEVSKPKRSPSVSAVNKQSVPSDQLKRSFQGEDRSLSKNKSEQTIPVQSAQTSTAKSNEIGDILNGSLRGHLPSNLRAFMHAAELAKMSI